MKIDLNQVREIGNIELFARQMVEGFITGLHKSPLPNTGFTIPEKVPATSTGKFMPRQISCS